MLLLAETFAGHLLKTESYLTTSENDLSSAKTMVDALDRIAAKQRADVWADPKNVCSHADVSKAHSTLLVCVLQWWRAVKKCRSIPKSQWSQTWRGPLSREDTNWLLLAECVSQTVTIKNSGIPHPNARLELFRARGFRRGKTKGQYFGALEFRNLVKEKQKWKAYGEVIMSLTV